MLLPASLVLALAVIAFALGVDHPRPSPVMHGVLVAGVLAVTVAARAVGRLGPQDPRLGGEEAFAAAFGAYRQRMLTRFAVAESPVVALLLLAFVLDHGPWVYVIAGPVAVLALAWTIWPSRSNVRRAAEELERDGARTGLLDAFTLH